MDALSDQQRLAVNLGQAEVRLRSVLHAIDEFDQERDPLFEELTNQEHDYQLYLRFARNRSLDKWTRDTSKILLQIIKKDIRKVTDRSKRESVSFSAINGKRFQSSAQLKKPGLINSKRTKTQNPETKFSTTKRRNIHI